MFTRVHHIAFVVRDLRPWVDRFERMFGYNAIAVERMAGQFELEVALFDIGTLLVELIAPTTDSGWARSHLDEHGEGLFHLAFEVDDIGAGMRHLESLGYSFEDKAPRQGLDWLVATLDPADTLVTMQLVEDPLDAAHRVDALRNRS